MRSSIVETMSEDYVTTARAMGLRDGRILRHHAFPNAILPTVSLIAINLGYIVAGAITVEVVFNWPGLGTLVCRGVDGPRLPGPPGHLPVARRFGRPRQPRADLVYGALDPRVRT